jgi:hypothetical protein
VAKAREKKMIVVLKKETLYGIFGALLYIFVLFQCVNNKVP